MNEVLEEIVAVCHSIHEMLLKAFLSIFWCRRVLSLFHRVRRFKSADTDKFSISFFIYVLVKVCCTFFILIKFLSFILTQSTETWTKDEMFRMQNHRSRKLYRSSDGTFAISMQTDVSRCWSAAIP
jgi:hypothetical protein